MTPYQIKLFTFYYSELNILKWKAKLMCRNVEDREDEESQDENINRMRQLIYFAGTQTRYSEWESLSEADYFFEEKLQQPVPKNVDLDNDNIDVNWYETRETRRKIFRDIFKDCIA
jgi:hypothetical protein